MISRNPAYHPLARRSTTSVFTAITTATNTSISVHSALTCRDTPVLTDE